MQALTSAVSSQLPGVNVPIGDNFMLSLSPSFAMGPEALVFGANATATLYDDVGSLSIGGGLSNTGFQIGGSASYRGASYYYSYLGGGTKKAQHTGGIGYSNGNFSMRFENDVLAFRGNDMFRTGGVEFQIGGIVFGSYVETNDPERIGGENPVDYSGVNMSGKTNRPRKGKSWGAWKKGIVESSPFYVGYKYGRTTYRAGINHPIIQDKSQNFIHRNIMAQNYYNRYADYAGPYFQFGYSNPFSIYYY